MKEFNTTGICYPEDHYMVNIDSRIDEIEKAVAKGEYITINRGRQYGKTTTLYHLAEKLQENYVVFSISFERMGEAEFGTDDALAYNFLDKMRKMLRVAKNTNDYVRNSLKKAVEDNSEKCLIKFSFLDDFFTDLCDNSDKPIVLIIDEVDSASNYESFIKLLRLLREKYLIREQIPTFQSVILAGVYDIKNLKLKVRPDSDHQYNSPWNIAVAYTTDMSLPTDGIQQMLQEYESDHHTGMDTALMAQMITDYTSGYPFFVSRVCQLIDKQNFSWDKDGLQNAVKIILTERCPLFTELFDLMDSHPALKKSIREILDGRYISYNNYVDGLNIASTLNIITDENGQAKISNKIFETRFKNFFEFEKRF